MKSRRKAREAVLQALYQSDTLGDWGVEVCELYFKMFQPECEPALLTPPQCENLTFAKSIIAGVGGALTDIDTHITASSTHWSVARMSRVDRNILRASVYELLFHPQTPSSVIINEAIELAKKFGCDDSPMFVNGVLDHVARLFRPAPSEAVVGRVERSAEPAAAAVIAESAAAPVSAEAEIPVRRRAG